MSLPWFPFNIKDFLANTKRLNTEAKGAYLCLMLDYYEQEGPAPDDDDVLAAICELPVDAWKRHRKVIAPLFEIKDGFWHHARIEREIESGNTKLAQSKARAQAGAAAMHLKKGHKLASSNQPASQKQPSAPISASGELQAQLKQSPMDAPLHLPIDTSLSVLDVAGEKDNSGDNSLQALEEQILATAGAAVQELLDRDEESLGTTIDPKFRPCSNHLAACNFDGASEETVDREIAAFIATHQERGTFSHDWDASWTMWWKRWKDHRDKEATKAKPRVEVSSKFQPTEDQWSEMAVRFARDASQWSRQYGPEPGMARCRCPHRILLMAGVDPATGLKISGAIADMKLAALKPEKV